MGDQSRSDSVDGNKRGGDFTSPLIHWTDLWLAVFILVCCAALYYATTRFEEVSPLMAQNIPPEFFPRLLIWTIVALTLLLPFEHLFLGLGRGDIDKDRSVRVKPMAILTAILLCGIVASILVIGTMLAMALVCVLLPLLWGERRLKVLVSFAILFPGAVALLFTQVLKVYFEPGMVGLVLH
jgi:putative tricarboxylic transport membrane protein